MLHGVTCVWLEDSDAVKAVLRASGEALSPPNRASGQGTRGLHGKFHEHGRRGWKENWHEVIPRLGRGKCVHAARPELPRDGAGGSPGVGGEGRGPWRETSGAAPSGRASLGAMQQARASDARQVALLQGPGQSSTTGSYNWSPQVGNSAAELH